MIGPLWRSARLLLCLPLLALSGLLEASEPITCTVCAGDQVRTAQPFNATRDESGFYRLDQTGAASLAIVRFRFREDDGDPGQVDVDALHEQWEHSSYGRRRFTVTQSPLIELPHSRQEYNDQEAGEYYGVTLRRILQEDHDLDLDAFDYYMLVACRGRPFITINGGQAELTGPASLITAAGNDYVVAHELGHCHGAQHATLWQPDDRSAIIGTGTDEEYGNDHDIMAQGRRDFGAAIKWYFNWLHNEEVHIVDSSGRYAIRAHDLGAVVAGERYGILVSQEALPFGTQVRGYYFFEFRQDATTDHANNGLLGIVHRDSQWNTRTALLDMTPESGESWKDATLLVGRTFSDAAAGIHVTPVSLTGSGAEAQIQVQVNLGDFPENADPTAQILADAQVPVGLPLSLECAAQDADGDELAYAWEFGDDHLSSRSEARISHAWDMEGEQSIRCFVSDMKGGTVTVETTVTVVAADGLGRQLRIGQDGDPGLEPLLESNSGSVVPADGGLWSILGLDRAVDTRVGFAPVDDG
ncbi:MAG: PKD domain-containing protein [Planctomycetota bacterium]